MPDKVFLHIGFVNYKSWEMSGLRLVEKTSDQNGRALTLCVEALKQIDEGNRRRPTALFSEEDVPYFEEWSDDVCTLLQFVREFVDVQRSYSLSFLSVKAQGPLLSEAYRHQVIQLPWLLSFL